MAKKDAVELGQKVIAPFSSTSFRVELRGEHPILAGLPGKMRLPFIRILPGAEVVIEMRSYDLTNGRVTSRQK